MLTTISVGDLIYSTMLLLYACSDILTPLPALGMPFEIDDLKGPIIEQPIRYVRYFSQQPAALY
jgi:uroporphyrinogen-III decarboxylase